MKSMHYFMVIFGALLCCFLGLVIVLFVEVLILKSSIDQLRAIRYEYKNYLQSLRADEKYIEQTENDLQDFLTVNRTNDYLKNSALEFAKEHDLQDAVAAMYTLDSWFQPDTPTKVLLRPIKNKSLQKRSLPLLSEVRLFKKKDFAGQWPIHRSQFWLSSKFGPRRKHDGSIGFHYGVDMAALKGTPVYAIADGIVRQASYSDLGYGNSIVIGHTKKYSTRYAHLDALCVKKGDRVTKGALIGRVGATGSVRGKNASHLHFEVQVFGKRVNPLYILT